MMDWLASLDPRVLMIGIGVIGLLIALPLEIAAFRRLFRLKLVSGTMFFLTGGVVLLTATVIALVAGHLYTYARLTHEQEAARVTMRKLGERWYVVSVQPPKAPPRHYELRGDEWQIDARVLKWRPMGTLVGFDTVYRLERLSGRYSTVAAERSSPRTVHDLAQDEAPVDIWSFVRQHHQHIPFADALYGSAVYVPMSEGAEYAVTVSASGLVVRPGNEPARKAVGGWR
jgi:hypothetical protein